MNSKTDEALLDADVWARQEAIQVRGSYVVQAPAGSGKTELLTQRLLALLGAAVSEPEALLAITFTNKAAAEMRQRVLDSLIRASSQAEPDTEPDRTNWRLAKRVLLRSEQESWDLVENPGRLRIMTIDALCGSIAQQLPLLSEFGSQPNITDDAETRYREAAQEAVHYWVTRQSCEGGGHAARDAVSPLDVLLRVDNDAPRLVDLVARLLAVRDQWLTHVVNPAFMGGARDSSLALKEHIENSVQHLRAETRAQLDRLLHSTYPGLRDALRMHFDAARFGFDVVGDASSPLARLLFTQNSTDDAADDAADDSAVFMDSLVALLSTGSPGKKQFRKVRGVTKALGFPAVSAGRSADEKARLKSGKVEFQSLLESLQSADDLLAVLNAISLLPPPRLTTVDAQTLMQLIELLLIAVACLKVGFQSAGEVDFCEVSLGAMRALHDTDNHDAVIQLSQRYQHILVDEFQDTSLTQYHLLLQLISDWQVAHTPEDEQPPTLFLVGDPMQSIYRFRQAEVGLFLQVKTHGMGPAPLQYLRLTRNFRSDPEIVEWVNTHFRSIFPPDDDVTTGRVAYRASLAGRSGTVDHADHADIVTQSPVLRGVSRGVHCDWCESDAAVVQRCVELVQRIRQAEPEASIAILVRGRRHLRAVLPALSQGNVPYEAVEARVLSTEPVVQDLLVLTNVIAEPNNGLAWAALLRSPVCGLCLEDLLVVFETQNNVWPVLVACLERSDALPDLSAEGRQLIRRVVDPLRPMIDDYPYVSLSVKARWAAWATGLLAGVADRDVDCVEAYWALLERHTREGTPYCSETFALALDKAYGSILSSCANPVQIMTIHKSKGLEFDHVLIPFAEKTGALDDTPLLQAQTLVFEHGEGLLMAPLPDKVQADGVSLYQYLRHVERQKGLQELKRVLYVAVTRGRSSVTLLSKVAVDEEKGEIRTAREDAFLSSLLESLTPAEHARLREFVAAQGTKSENLEGEGREGGSREGEETDERPWLWSGLPINANVMRWDLAVPVPWQRVRAANDESAKNEAERASALAQEAPFWRRRAKANSAAAVTELMATFADVQADVERQLGLFLHECVEANSDGERLAAFVNRGWREFAVTWLAEAGVTAESIPAGIERLELCFKHLLHTERGRWIMQARPAMALEWSLSQRVDEHDVVSHRLDRCFIEDNTIWIVDFKVSHLAHHSEADIWAAYGEQGERYRGVIEAGWGKNTAEIGAIRFGLYFPETDRWVAC